MVVQNNNGSEKRMGVHIERSNYWTWMQLQDERCTITLTIYPPPPYLGASLAEPQFGRLLNDHALNPVKFRREWPELTNLGEKAVN